MTIRRARASPFATAANSGAAVPQRALRLAFLGRTSTEDQQDPSISIPRQLRACQTVIPDDAVIVAMFYDIESGRKDLSQRGKRSNYEHLNIPVRRDGGVADLLQQAGEPGCPFDAVICESVDRIARRTYFGVLIEHTLEKAGIQLMAADEPASISHGTAASATGILTRRIKQGVAEWYVLDMLEKSWAGFQEHAFQGYNIGRPPYGYIAERTAHPAAARCAEGKTKTRLLLDPARAPVIAQMFAWRAGERLSYQGIADRFNADPGKYPPPMPPDPARAVGQWTPGVIRGMLANPKYTGYMVWNRRSRNRGVTNPPEEWVCSTTPLHPPIITVELFHQAANVAAWRRGSRVTPGPNTKNRSHVGGVYPLRSFVKCAVCGYRMCGQTVKDYAYYRCPPGNPRSKAAHPGSSWVRQKALLAGLSLFLRTRLFGENRAAVLSQNVVSATRQQQRQREKHIAAAKRQIADLETRRHRLVEHLEGPGWDDPAFTDSIRVRLAELRAEQNRAESLLSKAILNSQPSYNAELLGHVPMVRLPRLLPEADLRNLCEFVHLEIHYDPAQHAGTFVSTITGSAIVQIRQWAEIHAGPTDDVWSPVPKGLDGMLVITASVRLQRDCAIDIADVWSR